MNDTLREYLSYFRFIIPLLRVKKIIKPEKYRLGRSSEDSLFYKSRSGQSRALIVYIHGGGWSSGNPSVFHFIGQEFAMRGYDCVLLGYSKLPKYKYKEIIDDVFSSYCNLKKLFSKKGRSYEKIVLAGSSAGGHLSALLAYDRHLQDQYGIDEVEFDGLVSLAGPLSFSETMVGPEKKLISKLFDSKDERDWYIGEPIKKLSKNTWIKQLIIHSKHDGVVGYEQAVSFHKRSLDLGINSDFYSVVEKENTHSAYCVGIFLKEKDQSQTLEKIFDWLNANF